MSLHSTKRFFIYKPHLSTAHRRQAALHEIQRLKVEGTLKPQGSSSELTEQGSLVITNLTLPLKKDYLRTMAAGDFSGLMRYKICANHYD
jgi:hypothetical protein